MRPTVASVTKPGGTGLVGPFPGRVDDTEAAHLEYDRLRRRVLWKMPSGLYLVGSTDRALRWNLMTLNWITQISFDPKWVGISVERDAYTHELIETSGVFSVCFVDREDRAIVRKFTKPVEVDLAARTLNGFGFHTRTTGARRGLRRCDRITRVDDVGCARDDHDGAVTQCPRQDRRRRRSRATRSGSVACVGGGGE